MKKLLILSIGLILLAGTASAANFKMVKEFSVPAGQTHSGSILSWGGDIDIDGSLDGTIILLGGTLDLEGQVNEDVICVGSTIRVGENVLIKGDFIAIGGTIEGSPTERNVKGQYYPLKIDLKKIESTLLPLISDSQTMVFFLGIKIILWLIITLIVFAVIPQKIVRFEKVFSHHILKAGTIGILGLITFIFLFFMFIILSFIVVGIPLLFALVLLYLAAFVIGRTVMFYFLGSKLSGLLKVKVNPAFFIVIGTTIYAALKFIPLFGPIVLLLVNVFEVGIGVGFIFRKKLKLEPEPG